MEIKDLNSSVTEATQQEQFSGEIGPCTTKSGKMRWQLLWMKFKKQKKKFFESSSSSSSGRLQVSYDPYTYKKNFDQGHAWDELDDLSRSFSARFADPSRVFVNKALV